MSVLSRLAHQWCTRVFGANHAVDLPTRSLRTVEEAIELCQALGVPQGKVRDIVHMVYSRPAGKTYQELGGVLMTTVILCESMDLDHEMVLESELSRVLGKPVEHFAKRNAEKPVADRVSAPGEIGTHVPGERFAYNPDKPPYQAYKDIPELERLVPRHGHLDDRSGSVGDDGCVRHFKSTQTGPVLDGSWRIRTQPTESYTAGGVGGDDGVGDGFAGIPHGGFQGNSEDPPLAATNDEIEIPF